MNLLDVAYLLGLLLSSPYWLFQPKARRKFLNAWQQWGSRGFSPDPNRPVVMIHAVSLGEMNATRALVQQLAAARDNLQFLITSTTETGLNQGKQIYANQPNVMVMPYPADLSFLVRRVLQRFLPAVVVLMELELWPNFLKVCRQKKIPVVLVNGRITERSFRRYQKIGVIARRMFRGLSVTCAQDEQYAARFIALGTDPATTQVTGTMKFDTAQLANSVAGDMQLAESLGIDRTQSLWVCGSTGPGEEEICLRIYRKLLADFPQLGLVIVPRKPERFDEVAQMIEREGFALLRRSRSDPPSDNRPVILGDTMGELRKFYSLGSVVFVGRTLVDQGEKQRGSDMIEPAALAKPTIVGRYTDNFRDAMDAFRQAEAIVEISSEGELLKALQQLLRDPSDIGVRAQTVVRKQQGATAKHVQVILQRLK
ncbi:MAG TPA: 3-deoxy-D-manno-octulosonic acid transferase [Tepidisphaeraceae bacterium]